MRASVLCAGLVMMAAGCKTGGDFTGGNETAKGATVANPASVRCLEAGGELEIQDEPGGQIGVCVFPDGSRCEEWRLFKGECAPGKCAAKDGRCQGGSEPDQSRAGSKTHGP